MKHTEQQIKEKAEQVLKDIKGEYYRENLIEEGFLFREKEKITIGLFSGEFVDVWVIFIASLFDNSDHLYISDESGEPIFIQNFNYISIEIAKNDEGKYYRKLG